MHHSSTTWLVPFKGRNHSGTTNQNFLWGDGSVYIMDNHRAAMWCWLQHVTNNEKIGLLHIDEHTDTLYSRIDEWLSVLPSLEGLSIDDYLALDYQSECGRIPIIRWDNYLSIYLENHADQICKSIFITHGVGDKPRVRNLVFPQPHEVTENIEFWMQAQSERWIVNVDLDYFFCDQGGTRRRMFSQTYIQSIFEAIRRARDADRIACLTICLTPDDGYTGGWTQAEELCAEICEILNLSFKLPSEPNGPNVTR